MAKSSGTTVLRTTFNPNGVAAQAPRLESYSEVVNHLLKRSANDQKIAEAYAEILQYTQPAFMTPLQHGEDLFAKAIRPGDVHEK